MNDYLKRLYTWISSKDPNFSSKMTVEDFASKMESDLDYNSRMYSWISSKDPMFSNNLPQNEFQVKTLKKKDEPVISTSPEGGTDSVSKDETGLGSLGAFQAGTDEQISGIQAYFERRDLDSDDVNDDVNIQAAIKSGVISDQDLIDAGYKQPEQVDVLSVPNQQRVQYAKNKISALRVKTQEEIDFAIQQKRLDTPYAYQNSASEDTFVNDLYDSSLLASMNVNPKDFDGFLEERGFKKDFLDKQERGLFQRTYGTGGDPELAFEAEKMRMLNLYVSDQLERDVAKQKLQSQKETGVNPDFEGKQFIPSQNNVDLNKLTEYVKNEMPLITKKLKERDVKNKEIYKKHVNGEMGVTDFASNLVSEGWKGFSDRVNDLAASTYGFVGDKVGLDYFSNIADATRLAVDTEKLLRTDNLSYAYASGKTIEYDGKKYLVDDNNQVYDLDSKIRVTQFLDDIAYNEIVSNAKDFGVDDQTFSATGTAYQTANVVGDLVVQIALTRGAGTTMAAAGGFTRGLGVLGRTKGLLKAIPMSREMASAIVAQATMGASSGYERTLREAKDAGLNDAEARELATYSSSQMALLYALTAPISPQTKATEAIFGKIRNASIKEAIEAYKKVGREGVIGVFEKYGKKALNYGGEGLKETFQENVQQVGEAFVVNRNINEEAGQEIARDTITMDEFVNTSILSFLAGGLMPAAGSTVDAGKRSVRKMLGLDGIDRMKALDYLSRNEQKVVDLLNDQVGKGVYTMDAATDLLSEINTYKEGIGKIPSDLTPETALEVMGDVEKIRSLEAKRDKLDPVFHSAVNQEIEQVRESIKQKVEQDAIQEQEARDIPDAQPAEGVQEVEEEVREPVVEEEEEITTPLTQEEIDQQAVERDEDYSKSPIVVRSRPKTATEEPVILSGVEAEAADRTIEKIVNDGIAKGQSTQEILDRILPRYAFNDIEISRLRDFVEGKRSGKTKTDFAAYKKGAPAIEEEVTPELYTLPETKKEWVNDFNIIDNRDGKAGLEINDDDGKTGRWYVENNKTGYIGATATKAEAQRVINDPNLMDYGEGQPIIVEPKIQDDAEQTIQPPAGSRLFSEPLEDATEVAKRFGKRTGIDFKEAERLTEINEERAVKIAQSFEALESDPTNPEVKEAYQALIDETIEQYKEIIDSGYTLEVYGENQEPYKNSQEMIGDLRENKNLKIFSTEEGFGEGGVTDADRASNPLLAPTEFTDKNGVPLLANDIFRFVHDFFGHAKLGNSFGPVGEENAWNVHSRMYSPKARRAMTTETRGQNSWVNFSGVNDEAFKLRDEARRLRKEGKFDEALEKVEEAYRIMRFADQKIGLLPEEFSKTDEEISEQPAAEQEQAPDGRPTAKDLREKSEKELAAKVKKKNASYIFRIIRERILDRQTRVKDLIKGIGSKAAGRAANLLVTKAGGTGYANFRFKKAEKDIYGSLSKDDINTLDEMIYAQRIISINKNREEAGREKYKGINGYNEVDAQRDLDNVKRRLGEEKFNDLNSRAKRYFKEFDQNLTRAYEAGLINEDLYNELKDIEYSPIRTIKYLVPDDYDGATVDRMANITGMNQEMIKKLSDENVNSIIMDSRWLLMTNIAMTEGRVFENRMLNAFNEAIENATKEEKEAFSEDILENPRVGTTKDGKPIYKYDREKVPPGFTKVEFVEDGQKRNIVIRKTYASQLLDIKTQPGLIEKGAVKLSGVNILRFLATSGNPLFIVGNTAIDFANILFLSDVYSNNKFLGGAELAFDAVSIFTKKVVSDVANKLNISEKAAFDKLYAEFMEHGGAMDYLSMDGIKAISGVKGKSRLVKGGLGIMKGIGGVLSYLGESSEITFRLAVFEKSKQNQIKQFKKDNNRDPNKQEMEDIMFAAAREARETIDFAQGGNIIKAADKVLPYLNASTQGFRKGFDYALKNPGKFASSAVQAMMMAGSVAALSLFNLFRGMDDDDEKRVLEILDSLSEYEKANYHIVFTGNKNKDGEFEYHRIKKLPTISAFTTMAEQMVLKSILKSKGVDYDVDGKAMSKAVDASTPIIPLDEIARIARGEKSKSGAPMAVDVPMKILNRNPLLSGVLSYAYNYDHFYGSPIFNAPRNYKVDPTSEGVYDDRVNQIYKDLAPYFDMSPKRTKAMIEKIITSETTNPMVGLIYSGYDVFAKDDVTVGEEIDKAMDNLKKNVTKKTTRFTNKNILRYKDRDTAEREEINIETKKYLAEQKVYNELRRVYVEEKSTLTAGEFRDLITENFDRYDWKKYAKKYQGYIRNINADRSILDIVFEDVPEVQAYLLYKKFGDSFEDEEKEMITKVMKSAKRKLSKKAIYIYRQKYAKK